MEAIVEFLEPYGIYFEIINFVFSLVVIFVSLDGLLKSGGKVKTAWVFICAAALILGLHELMKTAEVFKILTFGEIKELVEFATLAALLLAISKLKQLY